MSTIVTRSGKGSPLTHNEVDANFNNLNSDKSEKANNLSDLTSAPTARTNLGLVIGTDVLSPSGSGASLTSLSATNISSGTLAVARGGTGVTSSTGTTNVVLSTSPTITTPTITGYIESVVAIGTVTTAHTLSLASGTVQTVTLTTAIGCTFTMPTATSGTSFILQVNQALLGLGTATFTGVKFAGGTAPTITATASAVDMLSFVSVGSTWYGSAIQNLS
jgi:hypothetical protein